MFWPIAAGAVGVVLFVLYVMFRKPTRLSRKGDLIDHFTLNNALRKQEGKPPLKLIDGGKKR